MISRDAAHSFCMSLFEELKEEYIEIISEEKFSKIHFGIT